MTTESATENLQVDKPENGHKTQQFVEQLLNDSATAIHGLLCYIGDRLGIFKTMSELDSFSLNELATSTRLNERYLQEWLGSMVAAKYVEYDSTTRKYFLPKEHRAPLALNFRIVSGLAFRKAEPVPRNARH